MKNFCVVIGLLIGYSSFSQETKPDSIQHKFLPDITVVGRYSKSDYQQMPEVVGTSIYAGKKN